MSRRPDHAIREQDLPELARDMADRIGLDATLRLIDAFGGTRIRVPLAAREGNRIWRALGPEAATALSHHYGGERLDVPRAHVALSAAQRAHVLAAVARGDMSVAQAARRLGLTSRWVSELLNRHGRDRRQTRLF